MNYTVFTKEAIYEHIFSIINLSITLNRFRFK